MGTSPQQDFWERRQQTQENLIDDVVRYMESLSLADDGVTSRSIVDTGGVNSTTLSVSLPKNEARSRGAKAKGDVLVTAIGPGFIVIPTCEL